ncbi:MAG: restriction endonuclease subunit S [Tepidibacillus sp.]
MSFSEWRETKLDEVLNFYNGKKRPTESGNIPVYGGNGILNYCSSYNTEGESLIIGRVGAYCGNVFYENNKCWISDNAILAKAKENISCKFMYYKLKHLNLHDMRIGSSQPLLTQGILKSLTTTIPQLPEQKAIAATLSALDDMIELNNQINKTLEEIAQEIFKSWFVDFEPFKDWEFEESELGLIPKGWRVGRLGEIVDIFDSKRVPLSSRQRSAMEKKYPYYGAATLMDYVENYIFEGVHVLLGEDGTVMDEKGYPILQYVWGKFWVNNHAHVLKGKGVFSDEFLYMLLKNTNVASIVTGAVQLKINQGNLTGLKVIIPPDDVVKQYNEIVKDIFACWRSNVDEKKVLISLRDILLPKLMSGEIRVPMEEVV